MAHRSKMRPRWKLRAGRAKSIPAKIWLYRSSGQGPGDTAFRACALIGNVRGDTNGRSASKHAKGI